MTEEADADAAAFVGALDDAGNVGHYERTVVPVADDAEIGLQGGEGVIGDFRPGGGDAGEEGGFPGVGESDQTHVRENLQFQDEPSLHALFARLGETRCLLGGALEMVVAVAAATAAAEDPLLSRIDHLEENLLALGILDDRSDGHLQDDVLSVLALPEAETAARPVLGADHLAVLQVDERPQLRIGPQDDVAAPAAVSAVRSAFRNILRPVQMRAPGPSVPACTENSYVVYKVTLRHFYVFCQIPCKDSDSF